MDESRLREIRARLEKMNELIASLDPAIRAAAFDSIAPFFLDDMNEASGKKEEKKQKPNGTKDVTIDRASFFGSFSNDKPHENVHLVTAWLYSQYGVYPIETQEIRDVAGDVGLTIPARPDATMRAAKKEGNSVYRKKGKGYQLTVHGEKYLKDTYSVKKGTTVRPAGEDK